MRPALAALAGAAFALLPSPLASEPTARHSVCEGLPAACTQGAAYWNLPIPTATSVQINADVPETWSGFAQSFPDGRCEVHVRPEYANDWQVYAHEFGHCKGLHHDETGLVHRPDYAGIMDYSTMWDQHRVRAHDLVWEAELR